VKGEDNSKLQEEIMKIKASIDDFKRNVERTSKAAIVEVKKDILELVKDEMATIKVFIDDLNANMATQKGTNEKSLLLVKDEL